MAGFVLQPKLRSEPGNDVEMVSINDVIQSIGPRKLSVLFIISLVLSVVIVPCPALASKSDQRSDNSVWYYLSNGFYYASLAGQGTYSILHVGHHYLFDWLIDGIGHGVNADESTLEYIKEGYKLID
jgi:hypothetical protein